MSSALILIGNGPYIVAREAQYRSGPLVRAISPDGLVGVGCAAGWSASGRLSAKGTGVQAVRTLVHEIRNTIRCLSGRNEHATQVLSILDRMDLSAENQHDWVANEPPHDRDLRYAIDEMPESLSGLTDALQDALPQLKWRVDQGRYYPPSADVGDGYRNGNMHCELIGPRGSAFHHDDFTLGFFLLTPRVLYRDHAHQAPELYLTLSEPSGWRFDGGEWRDVPSGMIIWNTPQTSHATRV
ncbi:MAG: dimethylsulfonioproprionate lyase family protein, partial [Methyloligellaceae bacterium]